MTLIPGCWAKAANEIIVSTAINGTRKTFITDTLSKTCPPRRPEFFKSASKTGPLTPSQLTFAPDSMAPALFIEFDFEALRRPRFGFSVARIAPGARLASAAAGAGALTLERSIRVDFTDPAAIIANGALRH
jgi:hypothetical protein